MSPQGADDAPQYSRGSLAAVLPATARALGVDAVPESPWTIDPADRAVVVLVDGLGADGLARRAGHAPFLRTLLTQGARVDVGFPSTTATSMGSFGTGLPPGRHGMLGYEVLVPEEDRVFNELSWENGPHPERWQWHPTVFEALSAGGVSVTRIGPSFFDGSGLTRAALRGGDFAAAASLPDRVDLALARVRLTPRALVYLYWGDLDKVGHVHGAGSWEWGDELETIDRELRRLAGSLPDDTALVITADHGMVDVPHRDRLDLVDEPGLLQGVRHTAGEPRAVYLHCENGALDGVLDRWRHRLGDRAWVLSRDEAVAAGWFGAVDPANLRRIGDVVVAMRGPTAVVDSDRMRPELLRLVGLHGSLTSPELAIPVLHLPAGGSA